MKKTYQTPSTEISELNLMIRLMEPSLNSNTGFRNGGDNNDKEPDAKKRESDWGELW